MENNWSDLSHFLKQNIRVEGPFREYSIELHVTGMESDAEKEEEACPRLPAGQMWYQE